MIYVSLCDYCRLPHAQSLFLYNPSQIWTVSLDTYSLLQICQHSFAFETHRSYIPWSLKVIRARLCVICDRGELCGAIIDSIPIHDFFECE